jgi:hypothetical protein
MICQGPLKCFSDSSGGKAAGSKMGFAITESEKSAVSTDKINPIT